MVEDPLCLDTESNLITNANPIPDMVCASFAMFEGGEPGIDTPIERWLYHQSDPDLLPIIEHAFEERHIVAFNGPFDIAVCIKKWPHLLSKGFSVYRDYRMHDVMTREKLLDLGDGMLGYRGKYNFGAVGARRANLVVDKNDPWRMKYGTLMDVPIKHWPAGAKSYALDDASGELLTWAHQERKRRVFNAKDDEGEVDVLGDAGRQARAHWAIFLMGRAGIATDQQAVRDLQKSLATEFEDIKKRLIRAGLVKGDGRRNLTSAKVVLEAFGAREGIDLQRTNPSKRFPDGQVSVSEDALAEIHLPPGHVLHQFRRYGSIMNVQKKFIAKMLDVPVIRPYWDELKVTGRMSASAPPVQQLPREGGFRECLVARPGRTLLIADVKGAEIATWAQVQVTLQGDCLLADALRSGKDVHLDLAADILGITYEEALTRYVKGDKAVKDARQLAKAPNFGFPGGLGPARFQAYARAQYGIYLTIERCYELKKIWAAKWNPRYYFQWVNNQLHSQDYCTIVQPVSNRIRGRCTYTEACNTPFQGLASDALKDSMWRIAERQYLHPDSALFGSDQVLAVHDENVIEIDEDKAEAGAAELDELMVDTFRYWCPDIPTSMDVKISKRYRK